jgi:hypothetical protein
MDAAAIIIILMLCCCIMILVGGLGFFILKTPTEKGTPSITLDDVTVEAEKETSTTEYYTYDELSKNIKLNIKWSNGSDFNDVTNVYFTRTHGNNTEKKETGANGRKSNTSGNKIQFIQKPGEDMRGKHSIKVTYKLKGQTQEKVMTTFEANVSEDQLTLAADSVSPLSVSYSPTTVPFSTEVETQKTTATLNPNPSGFGALFFVPSGDNNAIKIKRVSDGKFLTHSGTWGATGGVFYVQSSAGDKRRISTTTTDDGKLLTSVGPAMKKYTDMNPGERQKSLFTISFAAYVAPSPGPAPAPCAGLTDTSPASSVPVSCLRKLLTDEGCTSSGTVWPGDDYDGWWRQDDGAGNYGVVKSDIKFWATSTDPTRVAGCGSTAPSGGSPSPTPSASYCYRYAAPPMRTLFYKSDDCTAKWGWGYNDQNVGAGGTLKGFTEQAPNTSKFCYRYAGNPMRTLFYKSDDCTAKWGWGYNDSHVGTGGEAWFYTSEQPNTEKYCYRYAGNPMRTLFYKSDDCTAKWGWGYNDQNVGAGGEIWVPK